MWKLPLPDPPTCMAFTVVVFFGVVYWSNPKDESLKGAVITAFSSGYGYLIGSSQGAKKANDRLANATGTDEVKK